MRLMRSWRHTGRLLLMAAAAFAWAGCGAPGGGSSYITPTPPPMPAVPPRGESGWWNDSVFYEAFVRSFYDASGDGTGDLRGLVSKLDYLNDGKPATTNDLGVTGLWLMPVAQSPSYHGYDVTDYYTVDDDYGTNADFQELVREAHKRGIKVIVDLVMNHTSAQHPWFVEASNNRASPYRDWYVWSTTDPGFRGPEGRQVWNRMGDSYYYALFWSQMPDLNFRSAAVTEEMYKITRYWRETMGVDGFRIDAVRHLIEDGRQLDGTPETHQWLAKYDAFTDSISRDLLTVGEVWDETAQVAPYVANDEMDLAFEFALADALVGSVDVSSPMSFTEQLGIVARAYPANQYAIFLTNHDQERTMTRLGGDIAKARLAATALLTLPGVPFIYYGEEIGMTGTKPDERIRTPMQWNDGANAGFSSGVPWEAVNDGYKEANVQAESADPGSLLNRYRLMLRLRNEHLSLRRGDITLLESSCDSVAAYLRREGNEAALVLLNFSAKEQRGCRVTLPSNALSTPTAPTELVHSAPAALLTSPHYQPLDALAGYEGYVVLLAKDK